MLEFTYKIFDNAPYLISIKESEGDTLKIKACGVERGFMRISVKAYRIEDGAVSIPLEKNDTFG